MATNDTAICVRRSSETIEQRRFLVIHTKTERQTLILRVVPPAISEVSWVNPRNGDTILASTQNVGRAPRVFWPPRYSIVTRVGLVLRRTPPIQACSRPRAIRAPVGRTGPTLYPRVD